MTATVVTAPRSPLGMHWPNCAAATAAAAVPPRLLLSRQVLDGGVPVVAVAAAGASVAVAGDGVDGDGDRRPVVVCSKQWPKTSWSDN